MQGLLSALHVLLDTMQLVKVGQPSSAGVSCDLMISQCICEVGGEVLR